MEQMKQFVDQVTKSGHKWTDPEFPTDSSSLCKGIDNFKEAWRQKALKDF
jgi:hypothetical protein